MLSHLQLFGTPWTVAHQAPLSMRLSRQEYWSGLSFPPPGDLPKPMSSASLVLAGESFTTEPPRLPQSTQAGHKVGSLLILKQSLFLLLYPQQGLFPQHLSRTHWNSLHAQIDGRCQRVLPVSWYHFYQCLTTTPPFGDPYHPCILFFHSGSNQLFCST